MKKLLTAVSVVVLFASCQKEVSFEPVPNQGGSTNGDLLVKALQISPATNDTNVLTFQWDGNKRLLSYDTRGKVQGSVTNISHQISRASDGKITTIQSKSTIITVAGTINDSSLYTYTYVAGSSKIAHIKSTQVTFLGPSTDSIVLTYNAANQVVERERFSDLLSGNGTMERFSKETYQYDANGNVTVVNAFTADILSGAYSPSGTSTYTFDGRKAAVTLGDESYAVLGTFNVSKNNAWKVVSNAVSSGTTYTATYTDLVFNSFNRPSSGTLTVTPMPPGYVNKIIYFYQ